MTEKKATIAEVRLAMGELKKLGLVASASRIRDIIGGGSQTTILEAKRAILAEGLADGQSAMPLALLQAISEPLIARIWQKAQEIAAGQSQSRIELLLAAQEALNEDIQDYEVAVVAAKERTATLETQVVELERQLVAHGSLGAQIESLSQVLGQMGGADMGEDVGRARERRAPARMIILLYLAGRSDGASNDAVDRMVQAAGYPEAAAQKARWHVENEGLVASGGDGLVLTDKGYSRVGPAAPRLAAN